MTKQIRVNDRVKKIDGEIYLKIDEVLPNGFYVATTDMEGITEAQYILTRKEIEIVRTSDDPMIHLPELAIVSFVLREELESDFDGTIEICDMIVSVDFTEYNPKLYFESDETDVVVVYVKL